MSELKPCPFCGASPEYKTEGLGGKLTVWIKCQQCRQSSVCSDWYGGDLGTMEAAWNTRSTPTLTLARSALEGVIRVADRKTVEFDKARAALSAINAELKE